MASVPLSAAQLVSQQVNSVIQTTHQPSVIQSPGAVNAAQAIQVIGCFFCSTSIDYNWLIVFFLFILKNLFSDKLAQYQLVLFFPYLLLFLLLSSCARRWRTHQNCCHCIIRPTTLHPLISFLHETFHIPYVWFQIDSTFCNVLILLLLLLLDIRINLFSRQKPYTSTKLWLANTGDQKRSTFKQIGTQFSHSQYWDEHGKQSISSKCGQTIGIVRNFSIKAFTCEYCIQILTKKAQTFSKVVNVFFVVLIKN